MTQDPLVVEYDVKTLFEGIHKDIDSFRAEFRATISEIRQEVRQDIGHVRDRVSKTEQRLDAWDTINRDRMSAFDTMHRTVNDLQRGKVGQEAVAHYKRWLIGLGVAVAGLVISVAALIFTGQ